MMNLFKKEKLTKEEKELKEKLDGIIDIAEKNFYRKNTNLSSNTRAEKKFKASIIKQYEQLKKISLRDIDIDSAHDKTVITSFMTSISVGFSIPIDILVAQLQEKVKKSVLSPSDLNKEISVIKYLYYIKNQNERGDSNE